MPTSTPTALGHVCWAIARAQPETVLDVGVGAGKWGVLAREYADTWRARPRTITVDGIEAWEPYITDLHRAVYDHLFIGDCRVILPTLGQYDLALCCDVLEHFAHAEGLLLLAELRQHAKLVIVTTPHPKCYAAQGNAWGNPHERHLHCYGPDELRRYGRVTVLLSEVTVLELGG